jgi:hypothetical protein
LKENIDINKILKGSNIDQLKAYLTAISSMDKLKIIQANRSSFGANTALTTLKKNLQKVYKDNESVFLSVFYNNINLRTEIFGSSFIELIDAVPIFNSKININLSSSTNELFNFIEIKTL